MESRRPPQDSKQVRWMGRPSEEQLLGPLHRPVHETNVSFEPPPPPEWILSEAPTADGSAPESRRWRLGPRDPVALAAVAAVVWLAVRSGDGLPFRSSEPAAPAAVGNVTKTTLAPDRLDVKRTGTSPAAGTADAKKGDAQKTRKETQNGEKGSPRGGGNGEGEPPSGGGGGEGGGGDDATKPLLQATVPEVGTVTVDQPEVPSLPRVEVPTLPALPDTGAILPGTSTLPLPLP